MNSKLERGWLVGGPRTLQEELGFPVSDSPLASTP